MIPECRFAAILVAFTAWIGCWPEYVFAQVKDNAKEAESTRRYGDGPLTAEDFVGDVPELRIINGITMRSNVFTDVRYTYQCDGRNLPNGKFEVRLTQAEVFAIVDRRKSWNAAPEDAALMDHEQGHFDISALTAARLQARFDRLIKDKSLRVMGADRAAALQEMEKKVAAQMDELRQTWRDEQATYDRETVHGADFRKQAEFRRQHREMLELLKREAEKRKSEAPPANPAPKG